MRRHPIAVLAAAILAWVLPLGGARADGGDLGAVPPGQFDFYVLSLTWVPAFCATHRDPAECGRGLGFGLHGLWPESLHGWPSSCAADALPDDLRAAYAGLFVSPKLIEHEWSRHGTCTALGPAAYFQKTQAALASIIVPLAYRQAADLHPADAAAIKAAFLAANPALKPESLALVCGEGRIRELHICLDKAGDVRKCEDWERAEDNCG